MNLTLSQRSVLLGMLNGLVIALGTLGLTALFHPFSFFFDTSMSRFQVAVVAALPPAVTLAVCIARLAAHRFKTPQDLDGSGLTSGTEKAKLLQALLQNTLEQMLLALPAYTAWSAFAPEHFVTVVLTASLLFLFGRILFLTGYHHAAAGRALGFALTFYPTIVLLAGAIVFLLIPRSA